MELLLNLVWVLLAALAICRWSRGRNHLRSRAHLIALVCLLALLFPVISATDDLHAMRPELEDSASTRRALKHACTASANHVFPNAPALRVTTGAAPPHAEASGVVVAVPVTAPLFGSRAVESGRAPPSAELL